MSVIGAQDLQNAGCTKGLIQQYLPHFIGRSQAFMECQQRIHCFAAAKAPILITGESGTGKELAARACHYLGARSGQAFVPVSCATFIDSLIESELFGHQKGAFTDAKHSHTGLVEQAEGGALFLDEVDSLSHKAQAALLRFLQDHSYRPVGGTREKCADVNIIAATNADLEQRVVEGLFRQDLFYRLEVAVLDMPALRDRPTDIPLLADHFLATFLRAYQSGPTAFSGSIREWMRTQAWPGNVRQLENWVHREFLLADGDTIDRCNLTPADEPASQRDKSADTFQQAKAAAIAEFDKAYITKLLKRTGGNVTHAAALANKERRNFGRLLKKYGIDRFQFS